MSLPEMTLLYRIHHYRTPAVSFRASNHRFDSPIPNGYLTCYFALEPLACMAGVFGRRTSTLQNIRDHRLPAVVVGQAIEVVDLTHPSHLGKE